METFYKCLNLNKKKITLRAFLVAVIFMFVANEVASQEHLPIMQQNPIYGAPNPSRVARLKVQGVRASDELLLVFHPSASDSYDGYDSGKMGNGDSNIPEIYTIVDGREIAIDGRSPVASGVTKTFSLGFRTGSAGSFSISSTFQNWDKTRLLLKDNNTGIEVDLVAGTVYNFTSSVYTGTGRFTLRVIGRDNCDGTEEGYENIFYCNTTGNAIPFAHIAGNFRAGTRFYSDIEFYTNPADIYETDLVRPKASATEYTSASGFPNVAGNATYYAIYPGTPPICYWQFNIKNAPIPELNVTNAKMCSGTTINLEDYVTIGNAVDGLQYTTTFYSNSTATTSIHPSVSPSAGRSYWVRTQVENSSCISDIKEILVTVSPTPSATTISASSTTICSASGVTLTADYTGAVAYQWYKDNVAIDTGTGRIYTATEAGSYTVTHTVGECISPKSLPVTIVDGTLAATTISASSTTICSASGVTLTADYTGMATYQWYKNNVAISGATGQTYNAKDADNYSVTYTVGTCTSPVSTQVTIVDGTLTATTISASSTTICSASGVTLTADYTGAVAYQWYKNNVAISGATGQTYNAKEANNYTVTYTVGVCTSPVSTQVTIVDGTLTATTISPANSTICQGGSVTLSADYTGATSYKWYLEGTEIVGATGSTYSADAGGNYTVDYVVGSCTSPISSAATVTVASSLTAATISPANSSICSGGNVTLTASYPGATSYKWYLEGVEIEGATDRTYNANSAGSYTVDYVVGSCTSTISSAATVTVASPLTAATISPANSNICSGGSVTLTASYSGATSYKWYLGGVEIEGATGRTYNAGASGNYTVDYVVGSCTSPISSAATVTVASALAATTISPANPTMCSGGGVTLTADYAGAVSYQWYKNGIAISGENGQTYIAIEADDYTVTYIVGVCTSYESAPVTVTVLGTFSVSGNVTGLPNNAGIKVYYKINGGERDSTTTIADGTYTIPNISCASELVIIPSAQSGYTTPNNIILTGVIQTTQNIIYKVAVYRWWYISTPFSDSNSESFDIPTNTLGTSTGSMLGYYSEQTKSYGNPIKTPQTLGVMDGIVASLDTNITAFNPPTIETFKLGGYGNTPNTGTLTKTVYNTNYVSGHSGKAGKNLLGNPYIDPIDFDIFSSLTHESIDNSAVIEATYWVRGLYGSLMMFHAYNVESGTGTGSLTNIIPVMQGFWVQASKSGTIVFSDAIRTGGSPAPTYRSPAEKASRVARLKVVGENNIPDEMLLVFNSGALDSYDKYDSEKMSNDDDGIPEIYTKIDNRELMINGMSPVTNEVIYPLGFRTGKVGSFKIFSDFENWDNTKVFLHDNTTGKETELTAGETYNFTSDAYDNTNRFTIIINGVANGVNTIEHNTKVFVNESNRIVVQTDILNAECTVYNALGQRLGSEIITFRPQALDFVLESGVYLVKVGNKTERVIVK